MDNKIKLSIVIPVYNNWNFTQAALKDLKELPNDHEIIVVDNGSTDYTDEYIKDFDFIKYIRLEENTGFAHAVNIGYKESSGQYVMFLNNDIRVKSDKKIWTQKILEQADGYLVGPTGGLLDTNLNFISETRAIINSPYFYMSGWNLTSSKKIWNKLILPEYVGPFTEEFKTYFEDTDLSFRAKQLKIPFKIIEIPVIHFGKMTSRKLNLMSLYLPAKEKFIKKWNGKI